MIHAEGTSLERRIMGKGTEIARCLGYRHSSDDGAADDDDRELLSGTNDSVTVSNYVNMWHLRTLAIEPGGLLDIYGRKLGWIKLAGIDGLIFTGGDMNTQHANARKNTSGGAIVADEDRYTYEQIQAYFEREMEVSKWHIQRERRRLRNGKKSSSAGLALSRSSSVNDLSSIASHDVSESSTPLTANLYTRSSGTPKSMSFLGHDGIHGASSNAVSSFNAFPMKSYKEKSSITTTPLSITISCPSLTEAATFDNDDNESSSPSSINLSSTPPTLLPATNPPQWQPSSDHFHWNHHPKSSYLQYSQRYQLRNNHKQISTAGMRTNHKKDRRPQERKLLVQIASSTVNLLRCRQGHAKWQQDDDESNEFRYYSGMQDLIAVLLIHLESPSLTSLLLKQIWESHLRMHIRRAPPMVASDEESFASFIDCMNASSEDMQMQRSVVSSYFPLLQVLDEELHDSICLVDMGEWVVGEEIHKWISSWFCCHDTLPLHVTSRLVDFFLASHPWMPLYLSLAVLCHPVHRHKFIDLSQSSDPHETLVFMVENLFSNLAHEISSSLGGKFGSSTGGGTDDGTIDDFDANDNNPIGCDNDEFLSFFIEEAILMAISFTRQVSPSIVHQSSVGMPWTTRSKAPTDYKLVQRKVANSGIGIIDRFIPSRKVDTKYQIALDASGISNKQLSKGRNKIATRVLILGVALFFFTQLLQLKQPLDIGKIGLSLMVPSKHPILLRAVYDVPIIENVLATIVSVANQGDIAYDPTVTPKPESKVTTLPVLSPVANVERIPPTPIMPIIKGTVRTPGPSYKIHLPAGFQRMDVDIRGSARLSPPIIESSTQQAPQKHEENQLLLENDTLKQPRKQQPADWFHRRVKKCSASSRKVISGIKKKAFQSLLTFREEYIALVENDNFFL